MALDDLKLSDTSSADLGGYFLVTITDLDLATQYPIQFQYVYADGRKNDNWSAGRYFTTTGATVPNEPQLQTTDVVGGAGFVKVTWSGNDSSGNAIENFDRVDVHISGTTFGDGTKPAGSFKTAGTQTFSCVAGTYIVQLKVYSLNGATSFFSSARTVTVTSATVAAESSVTPSTPTVSSVLGAIQLAWNGKTSSGGNQPYGFTAAKVYVGTTSEFTPSSSNQVDVLNFANGQNTLNIGVGTVVDGTALTYGTDYYVKIATTNGSDTSTAVSASGNPVQIGKVTNGDIVTVTADKIATGTLDAGSTITVGAAGGKRIELKGTGNPIEIFGSGGTSLLSYNATDNKLTIAGDGTFSGALSAASGTFTGTLSAATGSFSGTITASGGSIGGIIIASDAIQNGATSNASTFKIDNTGKARFGTYNGNALILNPSPSTGGYYIYHSSNGGTGASGKFSVSDSGVLTATGGNFGGTITNGSDYWNSNTSFQFGGSTGITKGSTGAITIGSNVNFAGDISSATGTFSGSITASSGTIAGIAINADSLGTGLSNSGFTIFQSPSDSGVSYRYYDIDYGIRAKTLTVGDVSNDGTATYPLGSSSLNVFDKATFYNSLALSGTGSIYINNSSGTAADTTAGPYMSSSGYLLARRASGIPLYAHRITDSSGRIVQFYFNGTSGGGIDGSSSTAPAFAGTSDYRAKKNIETYTGAVNKLNLTRPVSFIMKNDEQEKTQVSFIAHEFAEVFPEFVYGEKDAVDEDGNPDYQSISTGNLVPYLVAAIKELSQRLDALEA